MAEQDVLKAIATVQAGVDTLLERTRPQSVSDIMDEWSNAGGDPGPVPDPEPGVTEWFRSLFTSIGMMMSLGKWGTWEIIEELGQVCIYWQYDKLVSKLGTDDGHAIIGQYADLREIINPYHEIGWYLQEKFGKQWAADFEPMQAPHRFMRSGVLYDKRWHCKANIRLRAADAPESPED